MKIVHYLSNRDAKKYFLKSESYANFDLPKYFNFGELLKIIDDKCKGENINSLCKPDCAPSGYPDVNFTILNNKDGKYDWRPFQLIHPSLYVALVNTITEKNNWKTITDKILTFQSTNLVECMSWPVESESDLSDKACLVALWCEKIEQKSLELALDFDYVCQTDISNCYGSIYTHVIPWALHTKEHVKKKENRNNNSLVGNRIDQLLRAMSYGQTNGIPQGSVLMDFIAEIVLGYIDEVLTKKIYDNNLYVNDFKIIRYKDDYRIFGNSPVVIELIVKLLTEVLLDIGIKINSQKTNIFNNIVLSSLKGDKAYWIENETISESILGTVQILHSFAEKFPNSGTLVKQLSVLDAKLYELEAINDKVLVLISYIVDIALGNPRAYTVCTSILSKLLQFIITNEERNDVLQKVLKKFKKVPNTDFLEIWIQRMILRIGIPIKLEAKLCRIVDGEAVNLWNSDWLQDDIKNLILSIPILDSDVIKTIDPVINPDEVKLFEYN